MIDWDKPIQTVEGTYARLLETNATEPEIWHIVHVLGSPGRYGEVFIVNHEGVRCDDRAIYSKRQEPIIRNFPVKREGWVRVWNSNGFPCVFSDVVFAEKASAEAACKKLGGVPAFVTWEE